MQVYPKITAQQWKQKIQFLLQGEDYNQKCIQKSYQEIDIQPFYSQETTENIPNFYCDIQTKLIDEKNIMTVFSTEKFLENISKKNTFLIEIPYLNNHFLTLLKENFTPILGYDPIGNLSKTGNFYVNKLTDLTFWQQIFEKTNTIFIDICFLAEAGAICIQQIAYTMAIINEYISLVKSFPKKIIVKIASDPHWHWQTAKIRAIRWILESSFPTVSINIIVTHLSFLKIDEIVLGNSLKINSLQSAFLGGSNFVIVDFKQTEIISQLKKAQEFSSENWVDESYFFKNITYQMVQKSLKLWEEIEKSGGYLQQLKKHIIQRKIKEKVLLQQKKDLFPFFEISKKVPNKHKKTLLEPILPHLKLQNYGKN